jgi:hypothetical protein
VPAKNGNAVSGLRATQLPDPRKYPRLIRVEHSGQVSPTKVMVWPEVSDGSGNDILPRHGFENVRQRFNVHPRRSLAVELKVPFDLLSFRGVGFVENERNKHLAVLASSTLYLISACMIEVPIFAVKTHPDANLARPTGGMASGFLPHAPTALRLKLLGRVSVRTHALWANPRSFARFTRQPFMPSAASAPLKRDNVQAELAEGRPRPSDRKRRVRRPAARPLPSSARAGTASQQARRLLWSQFAAVFLRPPRRPAKRLRLEADSRLRGDGVL